MEIEFNPSRSCNETPIKTPNSGAFWLVNISLVCWEGDPSDSSRKGPRSSVSGTLPDLNPRNIPYKKNI